MKKYEKSKYAAIYFLWSRTVCVRPHQLIIALALSEHKASSIFTFVLFEKKQSTHAGQTSLDTFFFLEFLKA